MYKIYHFVHTETKKETLKIVNSAKIRVDVKISVQMGWKLPDG